MDFLHKKERGKNYTEKERMTLLNIIYKYKHIVENKSTNASFIIKKQKAWELITREYNNVAETPRNTKQLINAYLNSKRGDKRDIMQAKLREFNQEQKTGGNVSQFGSESDDSMSNMTDVSNSSTSTPQKQIKYTDSKVLLVINPVTQPFISTASVPSTAQTSVKTDINKTPKQYYVPVVDPDYETPDHSSPRARNKIILGSKPCGSSPNVAADNPLCFGYQREIKQEPIDDCLVEEISDHHGAEENVSVGISSAIILGTRLPGSNDQSYNDDEFHDNDNHYDDNDEYTDIPNSCVYLENWGPRLERSSCYCNECKILFPTRNCLDAHNSTAHSFLVAVAVNKAFKSTTKPPMNNSFSKSTARKSTAAIEGPKSSRFCNHCNKLFDSDTELIKHLYENLTSGKLKSESPSTSKVQIHTCCFCKLKFNNATVLKQHVQTKHPQILVKTPTKITLGTKIETPKSTLKPTPKTAPGITTTALKIKQLIPKNTLFKCQKCNVHFTTAHLAYCHMKICKNIPGDWTCNICKIQFNSGDKVIHLQQHKFGDYITFQIHPIDDDIYKKILCKCPECDSYLDESSFWQHCKVPCDKNITICSICDWPINDKCLKLHEKIHKQYNIVNSFIRVTYAKVELSEKRKKRPPDFTFNYCTKCNSVVRGYKNLQFHKESSCLKDTCKAPYICKICGLMVRAKSHDEFHNSFPQIKIHDMRFVRISDNKVIPPPIPNYPKCAKCNVCFLSKLALNRHDCADDYRTCNTCIEKFSDLAYKLHMPFHGKQHRPSSKTPMKNVVMPTLIPKYKTTSKTWTFLYLCKVCDIATDSYDKVVEHCQNHHNNLENYDVTIKMCNICNLKFDSQCYEKHKTKHMTDKSLNQQSFQVFEYDFNAMFNNDSWLELFEDLPSTEIDKIVANSIYRYVRTLKMKILSEGSPEFTVYQCDRCKRCINPPMAVQHYNNCRSISIVMRQKCSQCSCIFSSKAGLNFHTEQHNKYGQLKMRIVLFNSNEDEEFNRTLNKTPERYAKPVANFTPYVQRVANKMKVKTLSNTAKNSVKRVLTKKAKTFVYYKCMKCKCCSRNKSQSQHVCRPPPVRKPCPKCKLLFSYNLAQHYQRHLNYPNFRYKVLPLMETSDEPTPKKKLFKCKCDLHFITVKSFEEHLKVCDKYNPVSSEICSKCSLRFPTSILVNHLLVHHANNKYPEFEVKTVTTDGNLHKCAKCDVCFSSVSPLVQHYNGNHIKDFAVANCIVCCLNLPLTDMEQHEAKYHSKRNGYMTVNVYNDMFEVESTELVYMAQFRKDQVRLDIYSSELVKCPDCEVHFLSYQRFYGHVAVKSTPFKTEYCNVCGLLFFKHVLPVHKYAHHQKAGLKAEDFDIRIQTVRSKSCSYKQRESVERNIDIQDSAGSKVQAEDIVDETSEMSDDDEGIEKIEVYKNYTKYLFKCDICLVHLMTPTALNKHKQYCGTLRQKKCKHCRLNFFEKSLSRHVKIHHDKMKLRKTDFIVNKIYGIKDTKVDIVPNVNDTVLSSVSALNDSIDTSQLTGDNFIRSRYIYKYVFKCVECSIRFLSEATLATHINNKNHDDTFKYCDICDAKYHDVMFRRHVLHHHKILKLSADDIKVITCYKRVDNIVSDALFQCNTCEVCSVKENSYLKHISVGCKRSLSKREECDVCHLYFVPKLTEIHKEIQHYYLNVARNDIVLINDDDVVKMKNDDRKAPRVVTKIASKMFNTTATKSHSKFYRPPKKISSDLYKCMRCDLCFLKKSTLQVHLDSDHPQGVVIQCNICHYKFSSPVHSIHKHYHHRLKTFHRKDFRVHVIDSDNSEMPTMSQINENMIESENIAKPTTNKINKYKIESENSKPKKRRMKTYNISEVIKAKLRKSASQKQRLYKCPKCSIHFISPTSIAKHMPKCNNLRLFSLKCDVCNVKFTRPSLSRHKYLHHEYLGLKNMEVRTGWSSSHIHSNVRIPKSKDTLSVSSGNVSPNAVAEDKSAESDAAIEEDDSITINSDDDSAAEVINDQIEDVSNEKTESDNEGKLYRCGKCNLCFMTYSALNSHVHTNHPHKTKVSCSLCYYNFTHQTLLKHTQLHHNIKKLTKDQFVIVNYNEGNLNPGNDSKYKVIKGNINKPVNNSDVNKMVQPAKAHKIKDRQKDTISKKVRRSLKDVRRTQYKISELSKKVLRQTAKKTVYQCFKCNLTFISIRSAEEHIKYDCQKCQNEKVCEICDLKFTVVTHTRHQYVHHDYLGLTKDDLKVFIVNHDNINKQNEEESDKESSISSEIETPRKRRQVDYTDQVSVNSDDTNASSEKRRKIGRNVITLYKCSECQVYYVTRATCIKHMYNHTKINEIEFLECKACNLPFTILTLHRHIQLHHKTEFNLENVLIKEFTPRADSKLPVPEIYFAVDKLQSKLVSTTSDRDDCIEIGESSGTQRKIVVNDEDDSSARIPDLISFEDD